MKNWEKYEDELKKIGTNFVRLRSGEFSICHNSECHACMFYPVADIEGCSVRKMNWLYEEYEEPKPKLTKEEHAWAKGFGSIFYYVARNEDGSLWLHKYFPSKNEDVGVWHANQGSMLKLSEKMFPFITWDSGEIWGIDRLLGLEVEE